MGLKKYIDQQLDPRSIDDSVAEAKVKDLDVFNLSTAELFAKYPNPGALLQQLDGQLVISRRTLRIQMLRRRLPARTRTS